MTRNIIGSIFLKGTLLSMVQFGVSEGMFYQFISFLLSGCGSKQNSFATSYTCKSVDTLQVAEIINRRLVK